MSISITPYYKRWYVVTPDDRHLVNTHAEALALRDAMLDDIQRERWEGGIEYEVVDVDDVHMLPLGSNN